MRNFRSLGFFLFKDFVYWKGWVTERDTEALIHWLLLRWAQCLACSSAFPGALSELLRSEAAIWHAGIVGSDSLLASMPAPWVCFKTLTYTSGCAIRWSLPLLLPALCMRLLAVCPSTLPHGAHNLAASFTRRKGQRRKVSRLTAQHLLTYSHLRSNLLGWAFGAEVKILSGTCRVPGGLECCICVLTVLPVQLYVS